MTDKICKRLRNRLACNRKSILFKLFYYRLFVFYDFRAAGRLQLKLKPLCDALFCEVNPIPVKTALNLMGLEAGELRLPLCPPADASVEKLKLALSAWNLLPNP